MFVVAVQVMHLKGENDRVKEKLHLAEKSAMGMQAEVDRLYKQLDQQRREE